jgi:uncharacterized protein (DUF1778 family)
MPRASDRLHLRIPREDGALLRLAARRLDMSMSELVRRASMTAALDIVVHGRTPALAPAGSPHRDARSVPAGDAE